MNNLLSGTTLNFAAKREMIVSVYDFNHDEQKFLSLVSEAEAEESDAELMYLANDNGSYTYYANTWLSGKIKTELPATITDEKHLREVIAFIRSEI